MFPCIQSAQITMSRLVTFPFFNYKWKCQTVKDSWVIIIIIALCQIWIKGRIESDLYIVLFTFKLLYQEILLIID